MDSSNATWWKVSADGKEGYIRSTYLKLTTGTAATPTPKPAATASNSSVTVTGALAGKIANAKKTNSDTVGWIEVPNTNIDEPILYGANFYYATHNIYRQKSYEGVYPFYNRATKNIIVFGHNLRGSGTIFHQLHHLQEAALGYTRCQSGDCGRSLSSSLKDWYKSSSARIWDVAIYGTQKWEVFAMYEVKANEPISTLRNNWNPLAGASTGDRAEVDRRADQPLRDQIRRERKADRSAHDPHHLRQQLRLLDCKFPPVRVLKERGLTRISQ